MYTQIDHKEVVWLKLKIRKVGNSLTVTIPKELAEELDLNVSSEVEVSLAENKLVLVPSQSRWEKLTEKARETARKAGISEKDVMAAISEIRYGH